MNKENIQPAAIRIQLACIPDESARMSVTRAAAEKSGNLILHKWENLTTYPLTSAKNIIIFITLTRNPNETLEEDIQKPITDIEVFDFFHRHDLVYEDKHNFQVPVSISVDDKRYFIVNDKRQAIAAISSCHGDIKETLDDLKYPCVLVHYPEELEYTRFTFSTISLRHFESILQEEQLKIEKSLDNIKEYSSKVSTLISGSM